MKKEGGVPILDKQKMGFWKAEQKTTNQKIITPLP